MKGKCGALHRRIWESSRWHIQLILGSANKWLIPVPTAGCHHCVRIFRCTHLLNFCQDFWSIAFAQPKLNLTRFIAGHECHRLVHVLVRPNLLATSDHRWRAIGSSCCWLKGTSDLLTDVSCVERWRYLRQNIAVSFSMNVSTISSACIVH